VFTLTVGSTDRKKPTIKANMRRPFTPLLFLIGLNLILVASYLVWCDRVIDAHQPPAEALDAGMVFFSGFGPHHGLNDKAFARVEHGADLYSQGQVRHLICVGGHRHDPERYGAELMADALVSLGVPAEAIRSEKESFDTVSNWDQGLVILDREGWTRPVLISHPLHLARAYYIASPQTYPIYLSPVYSVWELFTDKPVGTWVRVHREWIAWLSLWLLPPDTQQRLVEDWRNIWD